MIMNRGEFCRVLVKGGSVEDHGRGTLYLNDNTKVFRRLVELRVKEHIMFRLEQSNALSKLVSRSMTTDYIRTICQEVKKEKKVSHNSRNVWIETGNKNAETFALAGM